MAGAPWNIAEVPLIKLWLWGNDSWVGPLYIGMFTVLWGAWHKYCYVGCSQRCWRGRKLAPLSLEEKAGRVFNYRGVDGRTTSFQPWSGRGWLVSGRLWPGWALGPGHRADRLPTYQEGMDAQAATWGQGGRRDAVGTSTLISGSSFAPWTLRSLVH